MSSFKFDLIGVGYPVIDFLITKSKTIIFPGGPVNNTLITLKRLGLNVGIIGRIGEDKYGRIVKKYLEKEGVDVARLRIEKFNTTKCTLKVSPDYSKILSIESSPTHELEKLDLSYLKKCQAIYTLARDNFVDVAHFLKGNKKILFISLRRRTKEISDIVKKTKPNIIFANEAEAQKNSELINHFQKQKTTITVITKGKNGCTVYYKGKQKNYPAFTVKCVDPTGAGDVFAAGFIYGYLQSWDINKIAKFSNLIAALSTTKIGSTKRRITFNEIQNLFKV